MSKESITAILFDLDNTLYPLSSGLMKAIDDRMTAYVGRHKGVSVEEALTLRQEYMANHGTTLRGLQMTGEVDSDHYMRDVHDVVYESYLAIDEALDRELAALGGVRKAIFTNAPLDHAERVLRLLGIAHHFEQIFDIRFMDYRAKPDLYAYERALAELHADPARTLLVEDTARNLPPAHTLGLTTIFIGDAPVPNADYTAPNILEALEVVKGLIG
ncbi:MAG: pyrimidine 5'-nucleotidase [Chloroflexales bacterium]|nr:pyrimidine 5'-nucleotidase [Chloroflexales bacterium]